MKLTHQVTLYQQHIHTIGGDLDLLPRTRFPNTSEALALQKAGIIDFATSEIARAAMMRDAVELEFAYRHERSSSRDQEPAWVHDLPLALQSQLRVAHLTVDDDILVVPHDLPRTGISYAVRKGGLIHDAEQLFKLRRLQGVRQLGFLQAPWIAMGDQGLAPSLNGNMSRYLHSLDVMAIASLIGANAELPASLFNTLRLASVTHDWGTPAGGDSVKYIDPVAFDEDANYGRLLRQLSPPKWQSFVAQYSISESDLLDTILNRGLLGEILDIADKLAYVARDMTDCLAVKHDPRDENGYVGTRALQELVMEFPHICSIWDDVEVIDGHPVFSDAWRLIGFLKARVVLFRELYYHPRARFGEYLVSRVLTKLLYDSGELTRDQLLTMNDAVLEMRLNEAFGVDMVLKALSTAACVRSFATREKAADFEAKLRAQGHQFALLEDHLRLIKTGAHFRLKARGSVMTLAEAYPGDSRLLTEMANMLPAVHVYYFSDIARSPDNELSKILDHLKRIAVP